MRRPGVATTMSTPPRDAADLAGDRDSAVDGGDADADGCGQRSKHARDLLGKLAGRDEDQAARGLRPRPAAHRGDPAEHRQAEGQGLAGAGLGPAEYVAARHRVGQGARLDRERLADVARGQRRDELAVQSRARRRS